MPPRKQDKGWRKDTPAAKPRAPAPNKAPKKRKAPAKLSPQKGQRKKEQAVEPSSSNEGDGDGDAPAPAASGPTLYKCAGCGKGFPQATYTYAQFRKLRKRRCNSCKPSAGAGSLKPARSNEVDVTLSAKIINSKGEEEDSVSVPGDVQQRSVRVQHLVRIQRKKSDKEKGETPEGKVERATDKWLGSKPQVRWPQVRWNVKDAATGHNLGRYTMEVTVTIDWDKRRATVTEGKLMETLRKHQMGAISRCAFWPDYGNNASRFLTRNAEGGSKLLLKTYRDSVAGSLERKCNGTALASDKDVVVEAKQGKYPSDLRRIFPDVQEAVCILRPTVRTRGGHLPHFVAKTMEAAQAKCLRHVSTSAWKCAFDLTRPATPSTRLLDGVCSMAWTRDSPFDVPRRTKRA